MPTSLSKMPAPLEDDPSRGRRSAVLAVSLAVLACVLVLLAWLLWRPSDKTVSDPAAGPATVGSQRAGGREERAYAGSVGVDRLAVSRAENFLHQEVTTISGEITNGGSRPLATVDLTIEFSDQLNQIAQRETRSLFGPPGPPIPPGDHREFEVAFEHISSSWNMRQPVVKVTGLQFSVEK